MLVKCQISRAKLRIYCREEEAARRKAQFAVDLITLIVSGLGILSAVAFLVTM